MSVNWVLPRQPVGPNDLTRRADAPRLGEKGSGEVDRAEQFPDLHESMRLVRRVGVVTDHLAARVDSVGKCDHGAWEVDRRKPERPLVRPNCEAERNETGRRQRDGRASHEIPPEQSLLSKGPPTRKRKNQAK